MKSSFILSVIFQARLKRVIQASLFLITVCMGSALFAQDLAADNMLLFQRDNGGWHKHFKGKTPDYKAAFTPEERKEIRANAGLSDATIDNQSTTREIIYLVKAFKETGTAGYLKAAEKGIRYLLSAQYDNGGWPQYFPDASLYRSQITYNDNAMVNVLNVLQDICEGKNGMEAVDKALIPQAAAAVSKGISCILATQLKVDGKLTAWCAQYNHTTLLPEMARKYELPSISGAESVNIVRFLMRQPNPSPDVKQAITAAIEWLDGVKIEGYDFVSKTINGTTDKVLVADAAGAVWARFYEIGTNRPFFSTRESEKKYDIREIEYERRNGYAWYGVWPAKLISTEYPRWKKRNSL